MAMPDQIALITGSSSGFGLLTSIELAQAGFRVVATMRDLGRRERLDQTAGAASVAERIDVRALDVTRFDGLAGFVEAVVRECGRLDVLVNDAGLRSPDSPKTSSSRSCGYSLKPTSSAPLP